jgi:hypothetical protein
MNRTDPLRLNPHAPHTQPRLFTQSSPSQLEQETRAEQERRTAEAAKDRETGRLFK